MATEITPETPYLLFLFVGDHRMQRHHLGQLLLPVLLPGVSQLHDHVVQEGNVLLEALQFFVVFVFCHFRSALQTASSLNAA
jgi:hypothetical protein